MKLGKSLIRLRYILQYFPFTGYTLLYALVGWVGYKVLFRPVDKAVTATFQPFILLMARMAFWLMIALMAASLLSAVFCWLHYLWLRKKGKSGLQVSFDVSRKTTQRNDHLIASAGLPHVLKPLLGYVSVRMVYDNGLLTDAFSLYSGRRKKASLLPEATLGKGELILPDIKSYRLQEGLVHFSDMLRIISLPVHEKLNDTFYRPPTRTDDTPLSIAPKKTEVPEIRIDEMRRVEGELTHYKDFEPGDDVRRIVWKVFAKHKDLVVRIPERFEPYASHLYLYASFHNGLNLDDSNVFVKEMLNEYKQEAWKIYQQLSRQEWELRFVPDQNIQVAEHLPAPEQTAQILANSVFQTFKPVQEYLTKGHGAALIFSSFNSEADVRQALQNCNGNTILFFIELSKVFHHNAAIGWLQNLLFLPPKNRLAHLRNQWWRSTVRRSILKNEERLRSLAESYATR